MAGQFQRFERTEKTHTNQKGHEYETSNKIAQPAKTHRRLLHRRQRWVTSVAEELSEAVRPDCRRVVRRRANAGKDIPEPILTARLLRSSEIWFRQIGRAVDTKLLHLPDECSTLEAQPRGRAVWSADHPAGFPQCQHDVLALAFLKCGGFCRGAPGTTHGVAVGRLELIQGWIEDRGA